MTRLWLVSDPIQMWLDHSGQPERFTWRGQAHPVQGIANHWRVDIEWWRLRVWRDYFKLVTASGLLVVVYHDLVGDVWYVQRVYD